MLRVTQYISDPGVGVNMDRIWYDEDTLVVLDGSTSLLPQKYDGNWFASNLIALFAERSEQGMPLPEAVNTALDLMYQEYRSDSQPTSCAYYPSAAGIFVRREGDWLQILNIGDCSGYFFLKNGNCMKITDPSVKKLDDGVLDRCMELRQSSGATVAELLKTEEIRSLLLANRQKMNRPDGYRILSFGMKPCEESDLIRLPADLVERLVLFSDGFDEVQDAFLGDVVLTELRDLLREQQAGDPGFLRWPRLKSGDDASAIIAAETGAL